VNRFEMSRSEDTLLRDIAERKIAPYRQQIEKVSRFRAERDQAPVRRSLRHVHAQAKIRDANLVPAVLAGLQAGATMGELAGAMRLAYDTPYDPLGVLQPDF
jgi:methylmalonyl-CoA mutase N-terminal domain/subunit